ncbi:MAG: hypothetical protein ACYCVD_03355 [Desulfitobacteriaceae bacterium]
MCFIVINGMPKRRRAEFKDLKGILDLEKIIYRKPERIDVYIFLKVIAYFVLALMRS